MTEQVNERELVLDILVQHEKSGTFAEDLLHGSMDSHEELTGTQRAFMKRLMEGTIERKIELDKVVQNHLKRPDVRLKTEIRCLLLMSCYQILYMDAVPDFAAVNEAVRILKKRGRKEQAGFVNGVLRAICRDKEQGNIKAASLSEETSMPEEILSLWEEQYGKDHASAIAHSMMKVRPVCIRLNPHVTDVEKKDMISTLEAKGAIVQEGHFLPYVLMLKKAGQISSLPGFSEGAFTVQDESSALAVEAAGLRGRKGGLVLDLCAAPGGKATLAAQLLPEGEVRAFDLTKKKTDRIRENARRLHLRNLTALEHDATVFLPELEGKADTVLCDLPCSGLGVITRKREIKYRVGKKEIEELVQLQKKILANAYRYVKEGGVLLYSTCTIDRLENEEMADYIASLPSMERDDLAPYLPEIPGIAGNTLQLFPDIHGTDGFFMARFRRKTTT